MLAPNVDEPTGESAERPARRSPYLRILVGAGVALLFWLLLPKVPHDQTVVFELGAGAASFAQLEIQWQALDAEHEGHLTLNFPATRAGSPTPERVVRQFRLTDGPYAFRVMALHRDALRNRTEVTRQVTLDGSPVTLRLEELSP